MQAQLCYSALRNVHRTTDATNNVRQNEGAKIINMVFANNEVAIAA